MDARTFKYTLITVVTLGILSFVCLVGVFSPGLTDRWSSLQPVSAPSTEIAWVVHPNSDKIPMWSSPVANAGDVIYIEYGHEVEVLGRASNDYGDFCYVRFLSWTGYIEAQYVSRVKPPPPTWTPTVTWTPTDTPTSTPTNTLTSTSTSTPTQTNTPLPTATATWLPTPIPVIYPTPTPRPAPRHPAWATALCCDGTYSDSPHRRGTCSHHGGVCRWLR